MREGPDEAALSGDEIDDGGGDDVNGAHHRDGDGQSDDDLATLISTSTSTTRLYAGATLFCRGLELWQFREILSQSYHFAYYYVDDVGRDSLCVPIGGGTVIVTFCYVYNLDGRVRRFVSSPFVHVYYPDPDPVRIRVVFCDRIDGPHEDSALHRRPWLLSVVVPM